MSPPPDDIEQKLRELVDRAESAQEIAKSAQEIANSLRADAIKGIKDAIHSDSNEMNHPKDVHPKLGEAHLATILFMDIVGYTKLERDDDLEMAINLLNGFVRDALSVAGCSLDDVVYLPSGDGMCLCFSSSTDGPLKVAEQVQMALLEWRRGRRGRKIEVRMGIHCGNVLRVMDLKGGISLAGAAINITQRTMDCGDGGHILCTRDAYKQLKQMKDYKRALIQIPGLIEVKHGLRLKLYNYVRPEFNVGKASLPRKATLGVDSKKSSSPKSSLHKTRPRKYV